MRCDHSEIYLGSGAYARVEKDALVISKKNVLGVVAQITIGFPCLSRLNEFLSELLEDEGMSSR